MRFVWVLRTWLALIPGQVFHGGVLAGILRLEIVVTLGQRRGRYAQFICHGLQGRGLDDLD